MATPPSALTAADAKLLTYQMSALTDATRAQAAATLAAAMIETRGTKEDNEAIAIYQMFYGLLFSGAYKAP